MKNTNCNSYHYHAGKMPDGREIDHFDFCHCLYMLYP